MDKLRGGNDNNGMLEVLSAWMRFPVGPPPIFYLKLQSQLLVSGSSPPHPQRKWREEVVSRVDGAEQGVAWAGREWCPSLVPEDRRLIHCKRSTDVPGWGGEGD